MESLWGKQKLYVQRKSCLLIFHIRKSWSSDILFLTVGRGLIPSQGTRDHPLRLVSCQMEPYHLSTLTSDHVIQLTIKDFRSVPRSLLKNLLQKR